MIFTISILLSVLAILRLPGWRSQLRDHTQFALAFSAYLLGLFMGDCSAESPGRLNIVHRKQHQAERHFTFRVILLSSNMPPRLAKVASKADGVFSFTSLLQALPRHPESFTKCTACLFSTSSSLEMKTRRRKRPNLKLDPYRVEQARQRKAANLEKRAKLQSLRQGSLGDPVIGVQTPFLQSLAAVQALGVQRPGGPKPEDPVLNYQLNDRKEEVLRQLEHSKWLSEPIKEQYPDPEALKRAQEKHKADHQQAVTAIEKITSMGNSNSGDRTRINIQTCIKTFGRHNTDRTLPPKPATLGLTKVNRKTPTAEQLKRENLMARLADARQRAGPDTGSSEVQIAILTARINVLVQNLKGGDKINKRNLRLLVHRRQKLLKYLRRKERGGARWQNIVEQLGINDAMWKGEITLP